MANAESLTRERAAYEARARQAEREIDAIVDVLKKAERERDELAAALRTLLDDSALNEDYMDESTADAIDAARAALAKVQS